MISSEDNVDTVRRAFDLGASDYISRPFDARVVYQRITNTIRMYAKQRRLSAMVADQVSQKEKRSQMMIGILSRVVERRNGESRTHVQHISTLTGMLLDHLVQKTETYPLTQEMRRTISMASVLHDIGKMEIGEQVLNSPEPRTPEDEETMRQHTLLGARMLEELDAYRDEDFVRVAYQICRWHHERYDGSGYPDQLVGEQIPIAAQVVGLADAYETLTTGSGSQPPVPARLQCRCFAPARPGRSIRCCWTACGRSRTRSTMPCVVGRRPYKSDRRAARTGKALRFLFVRKQKTKSSPCPQAQAVLHCKKHSQKSAKNRRRSLLKHLHRFVRRAAAFVLAAALCVCVLAPAASAATTIGGADTT